MNGKNFCDQQIDSDIKQYKEKRKLTTGQGKDNATGFLLNYDYQKPLWNNSSLFEQREGIRYDPKAIQQTELVG